MNDTIDSHYVSVLSVLTAQSLRAVHLLIRCASVNERRELTEYGSQLPLRQTSWLSSPSDCD